MNLNLPPVKTFRIVSTHANGWSDHYGAPRIAAAYAGVPLAATYALRGIWHHGCFGPWEAYTPDMLACNAPNAKGLPILTARAEEAEVLKAGGYEHARPIGLPILYTPPSGLPRIPRSLLVMPCHTLVGNTFDDRAPFRAYAREIARIAPLFDHVVVCIHPSCRQNGLWIEEFKAEGIAMIEGAQVNDLNSLPRMRALFEQFETVTTNGWGSHIAYALTFGAKVSVWGTFPAIREENMLQDLTWAAAPATLKEALSTETAAKERAFLQEFLVSPEQAVANQELGDWLVGVRFKLQPAAMAELLRKIVELPQVPIAHLQARRDQVRRDAAALVASGRKQEATNLLLALTKAAVETKNAVFLYETLRIVCIDLAPLDPARTELLKVQADKLEARLAVAA